MGSDCHCDCFVHSALEMRIFACSRLKTLSLACPWSEGEFERNGLFWARKSRSLARHGAGWKLALLSTKLQSNEQMLLQTRLTTTQVKIVILGRHLHWINLRNALSTAGNSMTTSFERPSLESLEKRRPPLTEGERVVETLWRLQVP